MKLKKKDTHCLACWLDAVVKRGSRRRLGTIIFRMIGSIEQPERLEPLFADLLLADGYYGKGTVAQPTDDSEQTHPMGGGPIIVEGDVAP